MLCIARTKTKVASHRLSISDPSGRIAREKLFKVDLFIGFIGELKGGEMLKCVFGRIRVTHSVG